MKSKLLVWLLDLLYPPRCMLCHRLIEAKSAPVCAKCMEALPEHDGAERHVDGAAHCVVTFFYEGTLRDGFLRYKFEGRQWYARQFGAWLAVTVRDKLTGKFDLVTWVPVSRKRHRTRGYDQAELLCRETARELGMQPLLTLEKCTDNRAQSSLTGAEERFENAKGAYRAVQPERFAGKRVLLIDDIVTTGATMSECARVLRKAGAAEVVCAALATPRET